MDVGAGGLSAAPAGRRDERLALAVVLASFAILAALAPFAKTPLGQAPAFIPIYQAALVFNDLVTAALLFAQCRLHWRPLFVLACGYLFTACMIVAHTLTFPGLFSAEGLLGAGMQSTAWIYMFWHAVFPLFAIGYAVSKPAALSVRTALAGMAGTVALAMLFVVLATSSEALLPAIMEGNGYLPAYHAVIGLVWLCSLAALACLWRKRPRTVLDLWVVVVLCAWICEIALAAMLNSGRFDLGFYAGRVFGLAAASFVLFALIFETGALHARLEAAATERLAHDAAEALALAERFQPQVALLDLGLPNMDGFELARRLRTLPGLASVRLAAVTGYGQESDRARTAAAGFAAHFVKPVKDDSLLQFVWGLQAVR